MARASLTVALAPVTQRYMKCMEGNHVLTVGKSARLLQRFIFKPPHPLFWSVRVRRSLHQRAGGAYNVSREPGWR